MRVRVRVRVRVWVRSLRVRVRGLPGSGAAQDREEDARLARECHVVLDRVIVRVRARVKG